MAESGSNNNGKKRRMMGGGGGGSGGNGGPSNGFKSLGLSDQVYRGIVRMGFRMPTPVQRKSLPVALSGADTVVMARTGSGKTCAFLIPLLEKLLSQSSSNGGGGNHGSGHQTDSVRAIILSPTRELSLQTLRVFYKLAADTGLRAIGIHGGEGMEKQFDMLASRPDVVIATPGRLAHHLTEIPDFALTHCTVCVLDEADRLLEMGFSLQIRQIARTIPESCQKLLFSATMPKVLVEFTKSGFATDPTVVRLDNEATVSSDLRIAFLTCRSADKDASLLHLLHQIREDQLAHTETRTGLTLIFAATRHHVEYITTLLSAAGVADATLIYGSLDQEARKSNLAAFRSGRKPVLVVTDVAARGIDVPLIDHVVHYHFPPSPKLFVHRSGRAARAGRIGFCWCLVEPDELPYMVDLHLFLGRRLTSATSSSAAGRKDDDGGDGDDGGDDDDDSDGSDDDSEIKTTINNNGELAYTLSDMTPEMVHYGSVPESVVTAEVESVQRIMNSELSGSLEAEALRALTKVCNNAMKQYRRTRTEASREGIRRAKAILEGERMVTGQRVGGGAIPPHPLLIRTERQLQKERPGVGNLENALKREEFLRAVSNFRPKETVFEAFAMGPAKDAGIVSQVDKGRTSARKHDSSASLAAMKNMRRQMRMARDKGASLVVAGTGAASEAATAAILRKEGSEFTTAAQAGDGTASGDTTSELPSDTQQSSAVDKLKGPVIVNTKPKMSRAERRRQKKNPAAARAAANSAVSDGSRPTKEMRGSDFRDPAYFMDNDFTSNSEEAQRSRQIEAAMQPSAAGSAKGSFGNALRIEETMLDIVGDERDELVKNQRMMRWDKSKRKYVQTTVGAELSGDSKGKRMRLESGQVMKSDKMKLGEVYEKWQKKTNRSVGRTGVFDDADGAVSTTGRPSKGGRSGNNAPRANEEIKTAAAIKKERQKNQNQKIKNMKKTDRRALENKQREEKAHARKKATNSSKSRR